jgi:hypothetical protein
MVQSRKGNLVVFDEAVQALLRKHCKEVSLASVVGIMAKK